MKCLILAAGYATRLYPLTENFPKPLLKVGDEVIITGPTTGAVPLTINEIRVDLKPVEKTVKGERFSIRVDEKIRPSDKLFIWQPVQPKAHIPIE